MCLGKSEEIPGVSRVREGKLAGDREGVTGQNQKGFREKINMIH